MVQAITKSKQKTTITPAGNIVEEWGGCVCGEKKKKRKCVQVGRRAGLYAEMKAKRKRQRQRKESCGISLQSEHVTPGEKRAEQFPHPRGTRLPNAEGARGPAEQLISAQHSGRGSGVGGSDRGLSRRVGGGSAWLGLARPR